MQHQDLLYVSVGLTINMYTYPDGTYVGAVTDYESYGLCLDNVGDVYAPENTAGDIVEYVHGHLLPTRRIQLRNMNPFACALNRQNTVIAVTSYDQGSKNGGALVLLTGVPPRHTILSDPKMYFYYYCGYDDRGNLYIDGQTADFQFVLDELPKGGTTLKTLSIEKSPKPILLPGNIQWDGQYLALGDIDQNVVYRLAISGSTAKIAGMTKLGGAQLVYQFFITPVLKKQRTSQSNLRILGAGKVGDYLRYWNYPNGGPPTKKISVPRYSYGAVISPGS